MLDDNGKSVCGGLENNENFIKLNNILNKCDSKLLYHKGYGNNYFIKFNLYSTTFGIRNKLILSFNIKQIIYEIDNQYYKSIYSEEFKNKMKELFNLLNSELRKEKIKKILSC